MTKLELPTTCKQCMNVNKLLEVLLASEIEVTKENLLQIVANLEKQNSFGCSQDVQRTTPAGANAAAEASRTS